MKYRYRKCAFTVLCLLSLAFSGCGDKCKEDKCKNGGTCDNGVCNCLPGYEGENCETESRTRFLGTYNVSENCSLSGNWSYTANIGANPDDIGQVRIANFFSAFSGYVYADIDETTLTISPQDPDGNNWTVQGFGILVADTITFSYTIRDNNYGTEDNCTDSKWVR